MRIISSPRVHTDVAMPYVGRFAPSPTGPLHAGSVVAALASWLDARAHQGRWLVRIEDVDSPRCPAGTDRIILDQLEALELLPDEPPVLQSQRGEHYQAALDSLVSRGLAYPCGCTRREIEAAQASLGRTTGRFIQDVYPGTCRHGLNGRTLRAWRFRTCGPAGEDRQVQWEDRRLGAQQQHVTREVGDFVLRRLDGAWAYQLAVVVDDAAQGVTDVVRGEDLVDNTARQILLQEALGLPCVRYLHTPLVLAADGHKLSKQNGAAAVVTPGPISSLQALQTLQTAAQALGLQAEGSTVSAWLSSAVSAWRSLNFGMMAPLAPTPEGNPCP
jgi:glutamyl-Q tRNA(Asp) synthetase